MHSQPEKYNVNDSLVPILVAKPRTLEAPSRQRKYRGKHSNQAIATNPSPAANAFHMLFSCNSMISNTSRQQYQSLMLLGP